jgi:nicotinamidase-related amidase
LDAARARGDLVVFAEFGSRDSDGSDLPPWAMRHNQTASDLIGEAVYLPLSDPAARTITELEPQATDHVIRRTTSGPLAGTDVAELLRTVGVRRVVVTGVATDVCVTGWTCELSDSGFVGAVPVDACASPFRRFHDAALECATPTFAALTETTAHLTSEWVG